MAQGGLREGGIHDPLPGGSATHALSQGSPLTEREREVLSTSSASATIADIAERLSLSEGTVRSHLSSAIQKVGARNRGEAARTGERAHRA